MVLPFFCHQRAGKTCSKDGRNCSQKRGNLIGCRESPGYSCNQPGAAGTDGLADSKKDGNGGKGGGCAGETEIVADSGGHDGGNGKDGQAVQNDRNDQP